MALHGWALRPRRRLRLLQRSVVVFAFEDRDEALGLAKEIEVGTPSLVVFATAEPAAADPLGGVEDSRQAVFPDPQAATSDGEMP
ncbi:MULTISPECIES: hypothetical protein [Sinorhizobium]|uniref:hypothetical protein n=1 Tax=Sinorhizobium TaxID=28105 RepID=UPI001913612D|nr:MULTISPECIES: hypothetical protein [Sinorhizobium]WRW48931.1 hypothetical protein VPK21_002234 [Sinorhizobium kummerowiae]